MLSVSNNCSLSIQKVATENNFKINKNIEIFFPEMSKLLEFLSSKNINDIEKIFGIKNTNEFMISVRYLIDKYLKEEQYISSVHVEILQDLIYCIFNDVNKCELNEIRELILKSIKAEFYKPIRFESFAYAVDVLSKVFDKMVESNLINTNKRNLNEKKSVVLINIINLIDSEQKAAEIVSLISKKLFKLNEYIVSDKTVKINNNKILFLIDEKVFHLLKNEKPLNLKLDSEKKYVTLNLGEAVNLKKKSMYLFDDKCKKFIKTASNVEKLFNLINLLDSIKFKKILSHNNLFHFLYNHVDNVISNKNNILKLLKYRNQFKIDFISFQRNTEHLLKFFKTYSENELKILKINYKYKKECNYLKLNQKSDVYTKLNFSFYKDFTNFKIFMNLPPENRALGVVGGFEFPKRQVLVHLFSIITNEILILKLLKEFFVNFKSEISQIKEKNIDPLKKQKIINELQKIDLKLQKEFCCSKFSLHPIFQINTLIYQMLVSKFACMSLKKLESDYWLPIFIDDLYVITNLDQFYTEQQILLCDYIKNHPEFKELNQLNANQMIHRESMQKLFELFEEIKPGAKKDFKIKYAALPIKPSNIEMFFDDLSSKSTKENDSNVENIENASPPKNESKINVSVKNKKNKKLSLPNEPINKSKKPSLFGIPSPAVLLRGNPNQIAPQLVMMQKEVQTKNIKYVASEFHQSYQKLPGETPPWSGEHPRKSRWKTATLPLLEKDFPKYQIGNGDEKRINQEIQLFNHTIPEIAHRFIKQLGIKEKKYIDVLRESEVSLRRQKRVKYTAIAEKGKLERIDNTYILDGNMIKGCYSVGIRDGDLFHDTFSTAQMTSLKIAKSARDVSNLICEEFENKQYFVKTYLKNNGKISKVCINDKLKLTTLEIYKTKR